MLQKNSLELIKFANAQTSLICEAIGYAGKDGKWHNKIGLVMVLRDAQNKAVKTLRYYVDIPSVKVLCHDLWNLRLKDEVNEYKKTEKAERALRITPKEQSYRFSVMNTVEGKKESLYFDLSQNQARQMAITVLDYLRAYEMAWAMRMFGQEDEPVSE